MSRTKWYIAIVTVIGLLCGSAGVSVYFERKSNNEQAMIFQLQQLRSIILMYVKTHDTPPETLAQAMEAQYDFGQPIQWKFKRGTAGEFVDPFGYRYQYNVATGWVHSSAPGYEEW